MSDYPDYTSLLQIIGSDIMVPIDLQGAYIMMPVDIQAQYVTLEIDIVAQTVGDITVDIAAQSVGNIAINIAASDITLDINLAASDITLNVDITAQTIGNLTIDITAQTVAVYNPPEWAAKTGVDKGFNALSTNLGTGLYTYVSYTVTTGKTLYINFLAGWCYAYTASDRDLNQIMGISIYDETAGVYLFADGGNGGTIAQLNKPIVVAAGHVVWFMCWNFSNHAANVRVSAGGYEL